MSLQLYLLFVFASLHSSTSSIIPRSTTSATPTYLDSKCSNETIFAQTTTFRANLHSLLLALASNAATSATGFYHTVSGNGTNDAVYGLFLCRGDQSTTSCNHCVAAATTGLLRSYCRRSKAAVIWYDECMVRYSNESLFGKMEESPKLLISNNRNITGNQTTPFSKLLEEETMNYLAVQVANDQSGKKFASKLVNFTDFETLYVSGECTPDLTAGDCNSCLKMAMEKPPIRTRSSRVLQPSCNVGYEIRLLSNNVVSSSSPAIIIPATMSPTGKGRVSAKVVIATAVVVAVISVALLAICLITKKANKKHVAVGNVAGEDLVTVESLKYDFATLQLATNFFSDDRKLGQGPCGRVYKGILSNGLEVAVKRSHSDSGLRVEEFRAEVLALAKLQHRNLVRFFGFCLDGEERLLVYEYVPNESLCNVLFDPVKKGQLDWGRRYKIIGGIARGMLYLHQDSRLRIIHRDLKASNILLDVHMNAKIINFMFSVILGWDQTEANFTNRIVGTYGYMPPEYAMHGEYSIKTDVYSFGVLVLEIVSGKKAIDLNGKDITGSAWKKWKEGIPMEFVDPTIRDLCSSEEVMRCMHIGLLCTHESPTERPTMASVVLMLDSSTVVTLPPPQEPGFFRMSDENVVLESEAQPMPCSVNVFSVISELEPR